MRWEQRVAIGIAVGMRRRLIVEAGMDIIEHPNVIVLDVWELI